MGYLSFVATLCNASVGGYELNGSPGSIADEGCGSKMTAAGLPLSGDWVKALSTVYSTLTMVTNGDGEMSGSLPVREEVCHHVL